MIMVEKWDDLRCIVSEGCENRTWVVPLLSYWNGGLDEEDSSIINRATSQIEKMAVHYKLEPQKFAQDLFEMQSPWMFTTVFDPKYDFSHFNSLLEEGWEREERERNRIKEVEEIDRRLYDRILNSKWFNNLFPDGVYSKEAFI